MLLSMYQIPLVYAQYCPRQMMEASLYDKIMDQQRLEPEFFRVGFYGKKFPFFLRVKKSPYSLCVMNNKLNRIILLPST